MKTIPLTQGKVATVDDEDFEHLSQFKWCAHFDGYNWYAIRKVGFKRVSMHRWLLRPLPSFIIDHIDRDGLNNQRANLRICIHSDNIRNSYRPSITTSGYKGVTWKKSNKKWCAQIMTDRGKRHIGLFSTAREAALAYDEAARVEFKEFALTNLKLGLLNRVPEPESVVKND